MIDIVEQIEYLEWLREEDPDEYNLDKVGHDKMYEALLEKTKIFKEKEAIKKIWNAFKNYTCSLQEIFPSERRPNIPELISENIIKYIKYNEDDTITRNCVGDLQSNKTGKIEVKCFSSEGPISFSPQPSWNIIYFVDFRKWKENKFKCYECNIASYSKKWGSIKINKKEIFNEQCKSKRRPRIGWDKLFEQIKDDTKLLFEGDIDSI
jgi:hypothetical protein